MSRKAANCSAALRALRALLLAEGKRRWKVRPLDVGPRSVLGVGRYPSFSDCVAVAHSWLQRLREDDCWWFRCTEEAYDDFGNCCIVDSYDFLVFADLLPLQQRRTAHSMSAGAAGCESGASVACPSGGMPALAGSFKAIDGLGRLCRRERVPQYG